MQYHRSTDVGTRPVYYFVCWDVLKRLDEAATSRFGSTWELSDSSHADRTHALRDLVEQATYTRCLVPSRPEYGVNTPVFLDVKRPIASATGGTGPSSFHHTTLSLPP